MPHIMIEDPADVAGRHDIDPDFRIDRNDIRDRFVEREHVDQEIADG